MDNATGNKAMLLRLQKLDSEGRDAQSALHQRGVPKDYLKNKQERKNQTTHD